MYRSATSSQPSSFVSLPPFWRPVVRGDPIWCVDDRGDGGERDIFVTSRSAPLDFGHEEPPSIPDELSDTPCYFGFAVTYDDMVRYDARSARATPSSDGLCLRPHKWVTIEEHAMSLGIWHRMHISWSDGRVGWAEDGSREDIAYFAQWAGKGMASTARCPTMAKIDALREGLGIQRPAQWIAI